MSVLNSKNEIVRVDSGECYENSGYLICYEPNSGLAALGSIGHCSCYGTWHYESGEADGCSEHWTGSVKELIKHAKYLRDPAFNMERQINSSDYDYSRMRELYRKFLEWAKSQKMIRSSKFLVDN